MTIPTLKQRRLGAFWGLATGDALGAPLEFYPRDALPLVRDMISGGKFKLPAGTWTDDTSMALCVGHSLILYPALNPADLLNRFWDWASKNEYCSQDKAFGFGQNTLRALAKFHRTGQLKADSTGKRSDGNGSLMRFAPVTSFITATLKRLEGLVADKASQPMPLQRERIAVSFLVCCFVISFLDYPYRKRSQSLSMMMS